MSKVLSEEALCKLVAILDEAFEKPPGEWHHFTEASPDSGYFGTLAQLTVVEAGRPVAGTSVAEQVSHVTFVMETSTTLLRGASDPPGLEQWRASWQTVDLDAPTWERLQHELRDAYRRLRDSVQSQSVWSAEAFAVVVGTLAHVAYHLGAIKQKIAVLNRAC